MGIAKQFLKRCFATLVLVSDDLKELDMAACQLDLAHQVCHFHLLRWLWPAFEKLRKQLKEEHHGLLDEVWQLAKARPPDGRTRLYALWKGISAHRRRDQETSALYRLRLLILKLHDNWKKSTLDQREAGVPSTNNGTERAIGQWRIRSHSMRGFRSWAGLEGAFPLCESELA
jgi:hypothetical protein